jgi:hypothetical protein
MGKSLALILCTSILGGFGVSVFVCAVIAGIEVNPLLAFGAALSLTCVWGILVFWKPG